MKKYFLFSVVLFAIAMRAPAQGTVAFDTSLSQFGNGQSTILYLSGDQLFGNFSMNNLWLISVEFSASSNQPASSLPLLGPIDSVYPPSENFPGGETTMYDADFTLDETQIDQLLAGQAQIKLVQDIFSADPNFLPQTYQGNLLPVPEPSIWALFAAGGTFLIYRKIKLRSRPPI